MKRLIAILTVIMLLFVTGCQGVSVVDAKVDESGQLILFMSDGSSINAGMVKGADGMDGKDGIDGADGKDGRDGIDGSDGIGIAKAAINDSGDLMIRLTDDTLINAGEVKGKDGADGKDGKDGKNGVNGRDGKDLTVATGSTETSDDDITATALIQSPSSVPADPFVYGDDDYKWVVKYTGDDQSVVIPEGVEIIGAGAFKENKSITSVTLPDTVIIIEDEAFSGCTALKNINLPDVLCYIGHSAFKDCTSLADVVFPDSISDIKQSAFENSSLAGTVSISGNSTIGSNAFAGTHITDVVISAPYDEPLRIGDNAFANCTQLRNFKLIGVTNVISLSGSDIFSGCDNLTIYVPSQFLQYMYSNSTQFTAAALGLGSSPSFKIIDD